MFKYEQQIYLNEEIKVDHITFVDNDSCISLIESTPKQPSIFALLNDYNKMTKGKNNFTPDQILKNFTSSLKSNPNFLESRKRLSFTISHYAGPVDYDVSLFLDKTMGDSFVF